MRAGAINLNRIPICERCGADIYVGGRGRPPKYCDICRPIVHNEQNLKSYAKNREKRTKYQRTYRQSKKTKVPPEGQTYPK
jgi:hypothetical protein